MSLVFWLTTFVKYVPVHEKNLAIAPSGDVLAVKSLRVRYGAI